MCHALAEGIRAIKIFIKCKSATADKFITKKTQVRDCRHIAFVTLNGFCLLSKKKTHLLFLTDNIKMDRIPAKIK